MDGVDIFVEVFVMVSIRVKKITCGMGYWSRVRERKGIEEFNFSVYAVWRVSNRSPSDLRRVFFFRWVGWGPYMGCYLGRRHQIRDSLHRDHLCQFHLICWCYPVQRWNQLEMCHSMSLLVFLEPRQPEVHHLDLLGCFLVRYCIRFLKFHFYYICNCKVPRGITTV